MNYDDSDKEARRDRYKNNKRRRSEQTDEPQLRRPTPYKRKRVDYLEDYESLGEWFDEDM